MTCSIHLLFRLYAALLHFYPRTFRAQFETEMQDVFREAAAGAAARGRPALVGLFVREVRDWPRAVVSAHWHAIRKEAMMEGELERGVVPPESPAPEGQRTQLPWREALPAGLPHVLMAFVQLVGGLAYALGGVQWIASALRVAFAIGVLIALGIAWRWGWPRWSAGWFAYGFLLLAGLVGFIVSEVEPLLAGVLGGTERALVPLLVQNAYLYLFVPLLLFSMLYVLGMRDRLKFELTVLAAVPLLWTFVLDFSPGLVRTIVVSSVWLGVALVAVLVTRAGSVRTGAWAVLGTGLVVGLVYTFIESYYVRQYPGAPAHYRLTPLLLLWLRSFVPVILATAVLILVPLLIHRLWVSGRHGGPRGGLGFRLTMVGLALLVVSQLAARWLLHSSNVVRRLWGYPAGGAWLGILMYGGLLVYLVGGGLLGVAAVQDRQPRGRLALLILVFLLILVPMFATVPFFYRRGVPEGWPLGFQLLGSIPQPWLYVAGVAWLALGVWLVSRRGGGGVPRTAV